MRDVIQIIKELIGSWRVVYRIAKYDNSQIYANNYLGDFWHFADPLLQIGIMVLMFAVRGGDQSNEHASGLIGYVTWITVGMVTFFFMQTAMLKSAKSIQSQVAMLSRMNFSLSAIPMISIVGEFRRYFTMLSLVLAGMLFMDVRPSMYWLQFGYYFVAMVVFLYALSLVTSTVTVLIPDFYNAYNAALRVGMWVSGVIISVDSPMFPYILSAVMKLNPLYYVIQGFRETMLENPAWFWQDSTHASVFWGITLMMLIGGAHIHIRFRNRFMDLV